MDVADQFYIGYGDGSGGPVQSEIERIGNDYLRESFPNLDWIKTARVIE